MTIWQTLARWRVIDEPDLVAQGRGIVVEGGAA